MEYSLNTPRARDNIKKDGMMKDITDSYRLTNFAVNNIPGMLWAGIKSEMKRYDHSPRIRYQTPQNKNIVFSISDIPRVLCQTKKSLKISQKTMLLLKKFIISNRIVLLKHWYDGAWNFSTCDLLDNLKR